MAASRNACSGTFPSHPDYGTLSTKYCQLLTGNLFELAKAAVTAVQTTRALKALSAPMLLCFAGFVQEVQDVSSEKLEKASAQVRSKPKGVTDATGAELGNCVSKQQPLQLQLLPMFLLWSVDSIQSS